nr:ExeM/NucH family extracellular endonuclease [Lewinella sp. JB7]
MVVIDDELLEGTESIEITVTGVSNPDYASGATASLSVFDDDLGAATVGIHRIQGNGDVSPLVGNTVTVQGIVTGDFQEGLGGFYVQEEDADADDDSLTSEGIFVFASRPDVNPGDLVTVTATVEEYFGQTQLRGGDAGASIVIEATAQGMPTSATLSLPRTPSALEALEGMRVSPTNVVITSVNGLERFGEIEVTSGERLVQFTECNAPDAEGLATYLAEQQDDVLVIDDGRGGTNLRPIRLPTGDTLTATAGIRAGQTISGLTGVLGYGFDRFRIQPTETAGVVLSGNERPDGAPNVGGDLRVVSANVLNYFTTLNSRGADTEEEFLRQEAKIVAALCALNADIIGLIEIENNDNVTLGRLVTALTAACGHPYDFVVSPNPGGDQIMVALVYRSDRVEESGTAAALDTPASVFVGPRTNRVPLAQTFRMTDENSPGYGEEVTVCVNHLKSKGGGCGEGDDDTGGAGNCNGTRAAAARAIGAWLATDPTGVTDPDVLVIGDLNSYRTEEPMEVFRAAGYVNTKTLFDDRFPCGGGPPSYVFRGQWGSLDYALASPTLAQQITGATAWTVNAPEPEIVDYNTEDGGDLLYAADYYRFSDHDPIVVGLALGRLVSTLDNHSDIPTPVQLRRSSESSYTFVNLERRGEYLITNPGGQILYRGVVTPLAGTISTVGLPAGVYFLVLREPGTDLVTFKIVK